MVEWYWLVSGMFLSSFFTVFAIGLVSASGRANLEAELFDKHNENLELKAQNAKFCSQLMDATEKVKLLSGTITFLEDNYGEKLEQFLKVLDQKNKELFTIKADLKNKQTVVDVMRKKYEIKKEKAVA